MSSPTHVQRCRLWLEEQIEAMGTLRTSNSRDLSFKSWRQNTVTAIQRIWPDDRERVERFRRIAFTPPQARADGKLVREWFGKGIGESRSYLQSLLDIIDREGVPHAVEGGGARDEKDLEDEIGFPMLDLDATAEARLAETPAPEPAAPAGSLGVTVGYTTPDDQGATARDPETPAPPTLTQRLRFKLEEARREPAAAPPSLGEAPARAAAPSQRDDRPAVEIPRAPGLPPLPPPAETQAPAAKTAEPPTAPAAKPAEPPAAPVAKAPEAAAPPPPPRPAPPAPAPAVGREQGRVETSGRRDAARPKNGKQKHKKGGPKPKLRDLLGFDQFESRAKEAESALPPVAPVEPAPVAKTEPAPRPVAEPAPVAKAAPAPRPVAEPAPVAKAEPERKPVAEPAPVAKAAPAPPAPDEDAPEEIDEETLERARMDFMQNSPVFGVVGKPVQRRTDSTEFLDPDAVAVASLASELGRLGVPEAMKGSLAARLVDVARHLEDGTLDWALLRGSVSDAMQYPELARRLLPILLPWFERAA